MKTNTFPTIAEMSAALLRNYNVSKVEYDTNKCVFRVMVLVPFPCYDDGGGIDSFDFEESWSTVPFSRAYKDYMHEIKMETEWLEELPF